MVTRRTVGLRGRRYAFGEEISREFVDVRFLMEGKMIVGLFKFYPQEIVAVAFVLHFPAILQLGGKVVVK